MEDKLNPAIPIAAEMKRCKPEDLNPGLVKFLRECASLTDSVGGNLVSRQAIAVAVVSWETIQFPKNKAEDTHTDHSDH